MKTEAKNAITTIDPVDIQCAQIDLDSKCNALSAISNAIEVLASLDPVPKELISHTISRLAKHAVYLADTMQGDVGCFIEKVEAAQ